MFCRFHVMYGLRRRLPADSVRGSCIAPSHRVREARPESWAVHRRSALGKKVRVMPIPETV